MQPTPLKILTCSNYSYTLTPGDLSQEQSAFEAGEGVSIYNSQKNE